MKKHYDFSKSVKNPYLRKPKKQLTIRLDEDTIDYFRALGREERRPLSESDQPVSAGLCSVGPQVEHEMGVT